MADLILRKNFAQNLYFHVSGKELKFAGLNFGQWQSRGNDLNSIVTDPLFVDPARDDFRLQPDSPALKLGFEPVDWSRVGVRVSNHTRN